MPRQNTSPSDYPQAVLQQIEKLAQNIAIARKRRGESQAQWAKRLGISQPTMARIERGDPSVAMASYVMCMWLINPRGDLAGLIAPQNDHAALEREVAKAKSQRKPKTQEPAHPLPSAAQTERRKAGTEAGTLSEIDRLTSESLEKSRKSLFSPAYLPELARIVAEPSEKTLKEWTSAAPGLAALMAKKPPQKP
ncbi:helix-turn-helix transcriptional regulator [Comamonas sp. MYb21]|uniref:helix-turn-helix transcriptional regulator n=1 Tax=unclassified Comamonas TaxID=2638500 RepID=UPI000395CE17|nr:helix-turn-helix transcriptional regulator [Comamonas sp. B-9]